MSSSAPSPSPDQANSYDLIPYERNAFPQTHPDRLATIGRLFGLATRPVTGARVLELGCGSGANLAPMAFHLPGSEFVGIDLSAVQVDLARETIAGLGLSNVRVEQADILDVDASWGVFDYVLCHGVFSWVPDPVKEKILEVASVNLAPHGVAYVSYNTYPGWHDNEKMRDLMLFHTLHVDEPVDRIREARAIASLLATAALDRPEYLVLLEALEEDVTRSTDAYLFHDYLEPNNDPMYFCEFVARADQHGLRYLAEAQVKNMMPRGFPKETVQTLLAMSGNVVQFEQYLDFLRNRRFRQTLLCHEDAEIATDMDAARVAEMLAASTCLPVEPPESVTLGEQSTFEAFDGSKIHTDVPMLQAALLELGEDAPSAVPFEALAVRALERLKTRFALADLDHARFRDTLSKHLLRCFSQGMIQLQTWQPDYCLHPGERPRASPMAIYQAERGEPVVTREHTVLRELPPAMRALICLMDGTRDRASLRAALAAQAREHSMAAGEDGGREGTGTASTGDEGSDAATAARFIEENFDDMLLELARVGVMVS